MKIIHLLSSNHFSGAENVVCQIASLFKNTEYEMIYCSPDGQIREALEERNITYHPINSLTIKNVRAVLNLVQPDIIHAHDMRASFIASCASKKIPIISHIHNNGFDARRLSMKTLGFLWATRKIKHIFWVSKSACSDYFFYKFVKDKSSVIPNIIDLKALNLKAKESETKTEFDIVYLGRLAYPKNPMRFVEIINLIVKEYPDLKVAMIGNGDQIDLTICKVKELGLSNNIALLGYMENPLMILRKAKALVMTSFWEGTPMCALEALGLGTPVISTPVDGLKDIIQSNYNGYLSDSDEDLKTVLLKILLDINYANFLSENALKTAEELNNVPEYRDKLITKYQFAIQ